MDQGAITVEPGFLFDQGADFGFAAAYGLRERAMPEPLGMLEPGHGNHDDRRRPLYPRVWILRSDNREAVCTGGR